MSSAEEIIEYAERTGWIDIVPGVRLFSRKYLQQRFKQTPRVVEVSTGHLIEILEDANFDTAPYWFFTEPDEFDDPGTKGEFFAAPNRGNALLAIEIIELNKRSKQEVPA